MSTEPSADEIREAVRERYASAALQVQVLQPSSCCGGSSAQSSSCCSGGTTNASALYSAAELDQLPDAAVLASLGCGNPLAVAQLNPGETVLDLGSGGGIDVLLSARRVGPAGKAYGLDMTDEMLELARGNARRAGATNVEFLKGNIEAIPLPDASLDVIISNCVINLSADKDAVLREAFRVLRPGGRFAVADIVVQGGVLSAEARNALSLWAGCVSGALGDAEYQRKLESAGFVGVDVQLVKTYGPDDVPEDAGCGQPADLKLDPGVRIVSAFVRATKPGQSTDGPEVGRSAASAASGPSSVDVEGTTNQVRAYFDKIAGKWDELRTGYFGDEIREEVVRRLVPHPDMRVADVGSGTGYLADALAPLVAEVHWIDASRGMLDQARENLMQYSNVRYHLSDGSAIPLSDGAVDAVVANMYLHHAPNPAAAIAEMTRVLRPGGRLILTDMDLHDEAWMREEMADVWLGFARSDVKGWLEAAGLEKADVDCFGQNCCADRPAGGRASVSIFVATGRKPLEYV